MANIHALIPWREARGISGDASFDTLRQLQREMDSIFHGFFSSGRSVSGARREAQTAFAPSLDISETEKAYHLTAELPGVSERDIEVTLENGVLTLKGEKKSESAEKDEQKNWHRTERFYGSFQRSVSLPQEVDEENIDAVFQNGVLRITVLKSPAHKEKIKKVAVRSA